MGTPRSAKTVPMSRGVVFDRPIENLYVVGQALPKVRRHGLPRRFAPRSDEGSACGLAVTGKAASLRAKRGNPYGL
jgi:hypothetical protein